MRRRDGRLNRRLAYALAAMAASQTAVYVARPLTSYRLLGLGDGARAVGLVTAAYALIPLFLAIPLGRFADRRPGSPLLAVGSALQVGACIALGFARTPLTLGTASAVLGLGHLGLALGIQDVIARESSFERHDQHFGLMTAAVSLGQLAGPLTGGFVVGDRARAALTSATTRGMLIAGGIAAFAFLCSIAAERNAPELPRDAHESRRGSVATILRTRGVPAGIFASIAVLSAADVFTAYMPVLGEDRDIAPRVVGVLLALRAAASMFGRVGIDTIVRVVGRLRLIAISAGLAAAAFAAMTSTSNTVVLAALTLVAGIGLGFGQPLSMTMVVHLVPDRARATALAVRLTGNRVGQVAAPALAGVIAGATGAASVFWMIGGMLVASAIAVQRPALESVRFGEDGRGGLRRDVPARNDGDDVLSAVEIDNA